MVFGNLTRALVGILICCVLTGCGLRQGPFVGTYTQGSFPALTEEERARIHDISFPLEVEPTKLSFTESQMVLAYKTDLSQEKLISLYRTGMEYWGWEELGVVNADETCLIFSKPSKVCAITLRPEGAQTRVLIFSTLKKSTVKRGK